MAKPPLKILNFFIVIMLLFIVSQLNLHFWWWEIMVFAQRTLLSWKELYCALLSVAWLSRKSLRAPQWGSSTVTETIPVSVLTSTGVPVPHWHAHRMLLTLTCAFINQFSAMIATHCSCLWYLWFLWRVSRDFAFCVFVTGFCSSSGLQCVVRAWRCSACHSGLSTAQICYVVSCDGSDKILCLCFLIQCFCFNIGIVKFISALYL